MKKLRSVVFLLLIMSAPALHAQEKNFDSLLNDVDSAFLFARELAFNGSTDSARILCRKILQKSPGYSDVRILLGRTYAWEGQHATARSHFIYVFNEDPAYYDAINALIDLETWAGNYEKSLEYADHGLENYPGDSNFRFRRAKALANIQEFETSLKLIDKLIREYPGDTNFSNYKESLLLTLEELSDTTNVDSLFAQAREFVAMDRYDTARALLDIIIDKKPEYYEVILYKGRTFSWEGYYKQAREEFTRVLNAEPDNYDAIDAFIDAQYWSDELDSANKLCDYGLTRYPSDSNFLYKKVRALNAMESYDEALETLENYRTLHPDDKAAKKLEKEIIVNAKDNRLVLDYGFDYFYQPYFRRFHLFQLKYGKQTKIGLFNVKFKRGDLVKNGEFIFSNEVSHEFEIDAYPKIGKETYAYIGYGFSFDRLLFPAHRFGIEFYRSFPKEFEGSLGLRFMQFHREDTSGNIDKNNITVLTGSVSRYFGSWWFSLGTYIVPRSSAWSNSYYLSIRRFFSYGDHYISLQLGSGRSPNEINIEDQADIYKQRSYRVLLSYQQLMFKSTLTEFRLGYNYTEYNEGLYRHGVDANIIFRLLF